MSRGIDYGNGLTNINHETGIRYGVISQNDVLQAWSDSSDAEYGEPHCPKCGEEATAIPTHTESDPSGEGKWARVIADIPEEWEEWENDGCDYACGSCCYLFDSSEAYGEQPLSFSLNDGEYKATQGGDDSDIFILDSPFYTYAAFCSPCAPGACYLRNPDTDGERAYCFNHDFFEDGVAPYPIYRVADDSLVEPEQKAA